MVKIASEANVLHVIRPRRSRSAAAYSRQTFPGDDLSVCRSVCAPVGWSVCLSSALWKNGGSDLDAV